MGANRLPVKQMTEAGMWDDLVAQLVIGPVLVMATREEMEAQREQNRMNALQFAAAALRAAGEHTLAANLLD